MAYLKIRLSENEEGECLFKFSNDVGQTIRQSLQEHLEIQYMRRREVKEGDKTEIYLKDVPEFIRDKFQKAAVQLLIKNCGDIHKN